MPLGMEVGFRPSYIVLDRDPLSPKWVTSPPLFHPGLHCGQTSARIQMPLGTVPR